MACNSQFDSVLPLKNGDSQLSFGNYGFLARAPAMAPPARLAPAVFSSAILTTALTVAGLRTILGKWQNHFTDTHVNFR
jgi:hypothetical protein